VNFKDRLEGKENREFVIDQQNAPFHGKISLPDWNGSREQA